MTNAIGDLLPRDKYQEPPEVQVIKDFVREKYGQEVKVTVRPDQILIHAPGAALAGVLRPQLHEIQERCQAGKRLVLRVA